MEEHIINSEIILTLSGTNTKGKEIPHKTIYCCLNKIEKRYGICENKLMYHIGGGFGLNYKYCSDCYYKWNIEVEHGKKPIKNDFPLVGKCFIKLKK